MERRQIAVSEDTVLDLIPFHNRSRFARAVVDQWLADMTGAYQTLRQSYGQVELLGLFEAANGPARKANETDWATMDPIMRGLLAKLDHACEMTELDPPGLIGLIESGRCM